MRICYKLSQADRLSSLKVTQTQVLHRRWLPCVHIASFPSFPATCVGGGDKVKGKLSLRKELNNCRPEEVNLRSVPWYMVHQLHHPHWPLGWVY